MFTLTRRAALSLPLAAAIIRPAAAQAPQVLNRGNAAEPQTLDPQKATGVPEGNILRDLFEQLVAAGPNGAAVPGVAERWELSPDGKTYTFHLRANAKWSNGDALTANDFVFSMRRLVDPATAASFAWLLRPVTNGNDIIGGRKPPGELGVTAVDARTLRITLDTPTPYFLELLKHYTLSPVHQASLTQHGDRFTRPGNLIGNGPYMLTQWQPQAHVRVEKNPHYHAAASVQIPAVMYYPTEDRAAELSRYRAGDLHMTYEIPLDQVDWVRANMREHTHITPYFGTYYLTLNCTRPPFNDVRVRRALALTINREAIVEQITRSGETPGYSWVPPGSTNYRQQKADFHDKPMADRIAEARQLIQAAGFSASNPLRLEYMFNTADEHRRIGIALTSMWQQAFGQGVVALELRNVEWRVYLDSTAQANYHFARAGWIGGTYADASYFLEKFAGNAGNANTARWTNADYDRLLASAATEVDAERRGAMLEEAERIMLREMPIIPMYHYSLRRMINPRIRGYVDNPQGVNPSRYLSFAG